MAVLSLVDCYVEINSVDMSAHVTGVELTFEADDNETTNYGSAGWRTRIGGLKGGSARVSFNQDFATTTVDDRLWALFNTVVAFEVRATAAAAGTGNPEYRTNAFVNNLTPVAGNVGDLATMDVTWPLSGAVTRFTG